MDKMWLKYGVSVWAKQSEATYGQQGVGKGWFVVSITHLNRAPLDLLHRAWTVKSKPQKNLPCRQTPLGVAMWGLQGILHNQSDCAKEPRMNLDGKNCDS